MYGNFTTDLLGTVHTCSDISDKSAILLGDANRQISDLKFKLAKSEQEITALEQNVSFWLCSVCSGMVRIQRGSVF